MSEQSGAGCLKGLGVGCGSCAVLALVLAVSVWAGWGSIREMGFVKSVTSTVETAKSEAVAMTALRSSLNEVYPAVRIEVRADIQARDGATVRTLAVAIVDPESGIPDSEAEKETKAREIAARIVSVYPSIELYDQIRLTLVREGDGGARLGSSSSFQFAVPELRGNAGPPAPPAPISP